MNLDLLPTGVPVRLMRVVIMLGTLLGFYLAYKVGRYLEIAHAEEEKKTILMETYQEALSLVTHDRVRLITPEQYEEKYSTDPILEMDIKSKDDIRRIRHAVDKLCSERVSSWKDVRCTTILSLTEAITNVLKHTPGGRFLLYFEDDLPCFHVQDDGPGITLDKLPTMVFVNGFSTNTSLGAGFTIMLRYMKQIEFCITGDGTTLVLRPDLQYKPANPAPPPQLQAKCDERGEDYAPCCSAKPQAGYGSGENYYWQ